ncbi:MAG: sigma-70 family RNA polymerase sigma factor [Candidatus Omnitrophica bacterium]|nr:sigma-70 family RNA polymerase sigma factor [Candidatus Omnitrophota bacterium]
MQDNSSTSPDASIEHMMNKERVNNLLDMMTDREREILDMRFGLDKQKSHTLAEVAKKIGVSRERVRQIEEAALKKLRSFVQNQER